MTVFTLMIRDGRRQDGDDRRESGRSERDDDAP
jgi:hypothetical protein